MMQLGSVVLDQSSVDCISNKVEHVIISAKTYAYGVFDEFMRANAGPLF